MYGTRFVGVGLTTAVPPPPGMAWLVDINGAVLTDANGQWLYVPVG